MAQGIDEDKAKVDLWLKEISPSHELRKWYAHDPQKWPEFKKRYFDEIKGVKGAFDVIIKKAKAGTVTFLYSSKEEKLNNAVALKEFLQFH